MQVAVLEAKHGRSQLGLAVSFKILHALQVVSPQVYSRGAAAAGVSSFGMSGVNAHAVFAQGLAQNEGLENLKVALGPWQRRNHWPVPISHHFLLLAVAERRSGVCR